MIKEFVVSDANIFIDLFEIDLLTSFFLLKFEFYTTDLVYAEIKNSEQKKLLQKFVDLGKLRITSFNNKEVLEIVTLKMNSSDLLSLEDCSVWFLAKRLQARLLTGDSTLRKHVEKEKELEVNGILFVFEQLISENILDFCIASSKLQTLMRINPRLPINKCNEKIKLWDAKS